MTRSLLPASIAAAALAGALAFSVPARAQGYYPPSTDINPDNYVGLHKVDPAALRGDPVLLASGDEVGTVSDVSLSEDGTAKRVKISLDDGGSVWVPKDSLRFNTDDQTLLTNMSMHDLDRRSYHEDMED